MIFPRPREIVAGAALIALSSCVQTNVGREPLEESQLSRRTKQPASASVAPADVPPPASSAVRTEASASATGASEVVGEPIALRSDPCRSSGQHLRVTIPRADSLDRGYRGAAPGIQVRQALVSGTAGIAHARLRDDVFEADVWSRGSGVSVSAVGGESCGGGAAGSVTFEVVGHYLSTAESLNH